MVIIENLTCRNFAFDLALIGSSIYILFRNEAAIVNIYKTHKHTITETWKSKRTIEK